MRHVNWPIRLEQAITAAQGKSFAWGENDCALFVADCIAAMTGVDPAADFRGTYDSENAAAEIFSQYGELGIESLAEALADENGFEALDPVYAQRGDVVLYRAGGALSLGVVHMNGRELITVAPQGVITKPMTTVVKAWRVS